MISSTTSLSSSSAHQFIENSPQIKQHNHKIITKNNQRLTIRCRAIDKTSQEICKIGLNLTDKTILCMGCEKSFCAKHRQAEFHTCPGMEKIYERARENLQKKFTQKKEVSSVSTDRGNTAF